MPDHEDIRNHRHLQFLGTLLHHRGLWHLNRQSVAGAFFVGLFVAFVPIPFQMVLAACIAIMTHVYLPLAVALVWFSNPVTMVPLFYSAYIIGVLILDVPEQPFDFELSFSWLSSSLSSIWQPFLVGCLILGLVCGLAGYGAVQYLWRRYVISKWRHRHSAEMREQRSRQALNK